MNDSLHWVLRPDRLRGVKWPTWDQAALSALVAVLLALVLRRSCPRSRFSAAVVPAALEFALVASLYSTWRLARQLPLTREQGALERARQIVQFQADIHLPTELSLQQFVLSSDWLARATNTYYAAMHVPTLLIFLVWLYVRHREEYPHWRNGLVFLTACCLEIRFLRVAPPRFLTDLGYVDLSTRYGMNIYGPISEGVSDQFAAMPSIHVGWAAVVSFGVVMVSTSWWRWLFGLHVVITMLVVSATGNHWWLDGIVAILLLCVGLVLDTRVRAARARRREERESERIVDARSVESMSRDILDDRLLGALHLRALDRDGLAHDPSVEHVAFQAGTLDALMAGRYDGDATIGELLSHGDLGIGTIQGLGGELVVVDGTAFVVDGDGRVELVDPSTTTPFAVVCRFAPIVTETLRGPLGLAALHARIEQLAPVDLDVLAIRVDGCFDRLRLRSVHAQEPPYPPLVEVTSHQSEWAIAGATGTLVGFRFPDATAGVEVPGFHLHFLSEDHQLGGHVLAATLVDGTLRIDGGDELHVELPEHVHLGVPGAADRAAIRAVEGG